MRMLCRLVDCGGVSIQPVGGLCLGPIYDVWNYREA